MGSQVDPSPSWENWDSCHVFTAKEYSSKSSGGKNFETIIVDESIDYEVVLAFCQDRQVSEMSLFKLAWGIVVGTYAGVEDVCFGIKTSRGQSILRCRLDAKQTTGSLLSSMEEVSLVVDGEKHGLSALASSTGLFDTILSIQDHSSTMVTDAIQTNGGISADSPNVILEAQVHLQKGPIVIRYPQHIFSELRASRIARCFSTCILAIVANADEHLQDLDILPPTDAVDIQTWNGKDLGTYKNCLHEVIRERMKEDPEAPAVSAWDGDLTYGELDVLSSRLASKLYNLGVHVGSSVAFLFQKSKWTVVSILAILKAGGAAVALNPEFPVERLKNILEFTQAPVLLVDCALEGMLCMSQKGVVELIVNESFFHQASDSPSETSEYVCSTVKPDDVAYIQFTSGSTGQPKGIVIEHCTYLANAVSQHEACHVNRCSRVLQFASHSFDAILVEILTPLLVGACICIPSEERRLNDLAGAMRDLRVNWMGVTPTLAKIISPKDVPALKTLCTWGEAASSDMIETWADSVELINIYGPSENSVEATSHSWSRGIRDPSHMGKGMKAVNTWVVRIDNREKLTPIGAIGELVLQGPTVARGYLHDEARNAVAFKAEVPWIPPTTNSYRMYYTGDLVRYTPDGSLEFCGRRDTQVKIRGHRVELGEIEHHINQSNSGNYLQSVAEVVRPIYRPTQKILIAFICESRNAAASIESLLQPTSDAFRIKAMSIKSYLTKYLPSHFIPSIFLPLTYIPTAASGKADRHRLRTMVESLSEVELMEYSSHELPAKEKGSEKEILIARLWAQILGVDENAITPGDNFFWLGGNSILAMRLAVAAREKGIAITVAQVLQHPRLQDIASTVKIEKIKEAVVKQHYGYNHFSTLYNVFAEDFVKRVVAPELGIAASNIKDIALATDYQIENLAWSSLKSRGGTNYVTFDFDVALEPDRVQAAIERLVSYHAILRTVYCVYRQRVYQVAVNQLAFDIVHSLHVENVDKTTASVMECDARQRLDITAALVKFWLLRGAHGRVMRLIIRASHLQYDGVTLIRWCNEFGLAYSGSNLLPKTSFPEYMNFAANHNANDACHYWRKLLDGSSMTNVFQHSSIPWKHVLNGQVETLIDTSLVHSHSDITIGTTIKAAWALVLAEMASSGDVVFGSVVWGRNAMFPGVEQVVGACIDNIPVRVRLGPGMTRLQLLQQIQEQYFEAVSFENFQYKRIVKECTDWRPWERLSTLVEYENLGEESSRFKLGREYGSFTVDEIRPPADRHDVTIYSMPMGEKQTFIALDFCRDIVPITVAQRMLDRMVEHIRAFHDDHHVQVVLSPPDEIGLPHIPMSLGPSAGGNSNKLNEGGQRKKACDRLIPEDETNHTRVRQLVEKAWSSVLGCQQADLATCWANRVPFYNVWGNLIASYALARYYEREGSLVAAEDLLQNVDMQSQVALLFGQAKPMYYTD
ncbi:uncharacterized protein JN550_003509 [Neoarthrinium moseri]|uniref:uncharacterized protein n=1 Tax=Neoarthrinium moseri TaxID=1658444 RepID=UPI001FDB56C5|nr:uncharacterized protein JN550_003509 [Neoarthrinium moseri]KAI1873256.1 hypothetical protein JN550_003509 [Neoarthrinium moseri]